MFENHLQYLDFVEKAVKIIGTSCIFVRDSGDESALA
jgi:hypothetical protein